MTKFKMESGCGSKIYDSVDNKLLKFAVIIARTNGRWVFCKHNERDTLECSGGPREKNEAIDDTAKRELDEETGAIKFSIHPLCIYSVVGKNRINEPGEELSENCIMQKLKSLQKRFTAK